MEIFKNPISDLDDDTGKFLTYLTDELYKKSSTLLHPIYLTNIFEFFKKQNMRGTIFLNVCRISFEQKSGLKLSRIPSYEPGNRDFFDEINKKPTGLKEYLYYRYVMNTVIFSQLLLLKNILDKDVFPKSSKILFNIVNFIMHFMKNI